MRNAQIAAGLVIASVVAWLVAFLSYRFFDELRNSERIAGELAVILLVPLVLAATMAVVSSLRRGFIAYALAAAVTVGAFVAHHHAAPLAYDNSRDLVVAAFVHAFTLTLSGGMAIPMALALTILWRASASRPARPIR